MATDDHGLEVLKKAGEEVTSGDKSDYYIKNANPNLKLAYDTTSTASTVYIGYAEIGSATSAAVWQVYKIDTSTGLQTFADSDFSFDNVWDDRIGLSYG